MYLATECGLIVPDSAAIAPEQYGKRGWKQSNQSASLNELFLICVWFVCNLKLMVTRENDQSIFVV